MGATDLEIRLLGEIEVRRGGRPVALPASKRTRALLGYLVASGRSHLRSHLCDLLWDTPDDPRAALRWSLAKLRPLLDDGKCERLVADRERVAFALETAVVDRRRVQEALGGGAASAATDALIQASAAFRGEFLEGLELPDCYRYHEWCVAEREATRALRISILDALVDRLADEPEAALVHARVRVAVDPLSEAAHVAVIRLLGQLGRPREAQRQYETCRRILDHELGRAPSQELEHARRALGRGAVPAPSGAAQKPQPASRALPLVGRSRERALAEAELLALERDDPSQVLLFTGEPGIGKTRLLDDVAARVRARGGRALVARAFEVEAVRAYGPWIDALRTAPLGEADAPLRADLAPLLPELGTGSEAPGDRIRLFDAVARLLRTLGSADRPLALLLDDVQWLDEASAALLHFVARGLSGAPVLLACAARPAELEDNAPALRTLRALRREGRLREHELAPLAPAEVALMVQALGTGVDAERVAAESDGNPLLALEVARALEAGPAVLSDSLMGLIDERLGRLDEAAHELLPWAAALGRGFDLETLAQVTGQEPAALCSALEALERHRVLRAAAGGGDYDFAHDLVRQAAYRRLSAPRRRLVHAQIARALDARSDPDGALAADVARHAALAGDHERAATACLVAGERCLRVFAYADAAELAARGGVHVRLLPPEPRLRLAVRLQRLFVHSAMSEARARQVEAEVERLVREAQAAGDTDTARAGLELLSYVHWYSGDHALAHQDTLRAAEASRGADPTVAAEGLATTARCLVHLQRDVGRAAALLQEARDLAGAFAGEIVDIPWSQGLLGAHAADYEAAVPALEEALEIARRRQDRYPEWDCQARLAMIELERGQPAAALERCRGLADLVGLMEGGSEPAFSVALQGLAGLQLGVPGAPEAFERGVADLKLLDSRWMLSYVLSAAASLDLAAGRREQARARAEEALRAAEAVGRPSEAVLAQAVLALVAHASGEAEAARRHVDAARAHAGSDGLSARARQALVAAAQAVGVPIPTPVQTPTPTPRLQIPGI